MILIDWVYLWATSKQYFVVSSDLQVDCDEYAPKSRDAVRYSFVLAYVDNRPVRNEGTSGGEV